MTIQSNEHLYWDCITVGLMIDVDRPSAEARLEMKVGAPLARVLLAAVSEPQGTLPLTDAA